jgi:hypothetical protein
MSTAQKRRAFGFVAYTQSGNRSLVLPPYDHLFVEVAEDKGICWRNKDACSPDTVANVLHFLRTFKPPGTDAWEILLALFPEHRDYYQALLDAEIRQALLDTGGGDR